MTNTFRVRIFGTAVSLITALTLVATASRAQNPPESPSQLSPLPKIEDLEQEAKLAHMTFTKCEAVTSAYSESLTPQLITSIGNEQLHKLNAQAFACMELGGRGVRYGYQIKTIVDAVIAASGITTALQNMQKDTVKVTAPMLEKLAAHNNALVDKYNDLVAKHNDLVAKYKTLGGLAKEAVNEAIALKRANERMYAIATEALGRDWYSPPAAVVIPIMPDVVSVRQSPLHCTTQAIATFTYTNCF